MLLQRSLCCQALVVPAVLALLLLLWHPLHLQEVLQKVLQEALQVQEGVHHRVEEEEGPL